MSNATPAPESQDALLDKIAVAASEAEDKGEMVVRPPSKQLDAEADWLDTRLKKLRLKDYKQDIKARKQFANKLFYLIVLWLLGVFYLIAMSGSPEANPLRLKLPENVLLGTIGGTTASILGLLYVVVKYLFPKR